MSYTYKTERPALLTDEGQRKFLKVRDTAQKLLAKAGAFRMAEVLDEASIGGDSRFQLACVDRLVELGEIREITRDTCVGQHRVFVGMKDLRKD